MTAPWAAELTTGAQALGLALTQEQTARLLAYLNLLAQWNKVYNLTAVRNPAEMLTHHLLDSLAVIAPLRRHTQGQVSQKLPPLRSGGGLGWGPAALKQAQAPLDAPPPPSQPSPVNGGRSKTHQPQLQEQPVRLLDVGSGGGLPGAVIAICCPEIAVTCIDAVAKKTAFIQQAAGTLGLPNLHSLHGRVETLRDAFDLITSRAFATLADFTEWSAGALAAGGVWMAMKGKHPADEIAALPPAVEVFHVEQLAVPGLDAERCLVWMRRRG